MLPFINVDQLAAYVRRDLTEELLMAEIACGSACATLVDATDQMLEAVVDDEAIISSDGTDGLLLPELPVINVTSISIVGTQGHDDTEVPAESYWVDQRRGIAYTRFRGATWLRGHGTYKVVYSHGYTNPLSSGSGDDVPGFTPIPQSLEIVALTLAARILDQGLVKNETIGMYQSVYSTDESLGLSPAMMCIVARFRPGRRGP